MIWINLRFLHVFLRLCSVLALLSYDCRLAWFAPSCRRNMWVDAKPSEERLKSKPNMPKTWSSKAHPVVQSSSKSVVREVPGPRQTEGTTGGLWCSPRAVVRGARPCVPAPVFFFVFFVAVRLLHIYEFLTAILAL